MNLLRTAPLATPASQTAAQDVGFSLEPAVFPIALWQGKGRNLASVAGKLTWDRRPIDGAAIAVDQYRLPAATGSDGSFRFLQDRTVLGRRVVHVANAANARVGGQPLGAEQRRRLDGASAAVSTVFVITLDHPPALRKGQRNVQLTGTLTFSDKSTPVPPVALWDYMLRGTIRDARGKPVANAIASITAEGGEAFGLSTLTDAQGRYIIRFFPQSDDYYAIRVGYGSDLYVAPETVRFAEGKSTELDLVLPANGTILEGTGPHGELQAKEVAGAEYVGAMTGLASADGPVEAKVTWPNTAGRFTVTIPLVDFAGPASFYQAELRFFSDQRQTPGGSIPSTVLPSRLEASMPRGLSPLPVSG